MASDTKRKLKSATYPNKLTSLQSCDQTQSRLQMKKIKFIKFIIDSRANTPVFLYTARGR